VGLIAFDPKKVRESQEYKDYLEYLKTPEAQQREDEAWAEVERLEKEANNNGSYNSSIAECA
jgi:hypothetical protein